MHIYFYDTFVNQAKFENSISKIETRITDLGLNGRIVRLGVMQNIYAAVENEIKRGAKSLIAVGNNHTLNQIINAVAALILTHRIGQDIPIGIIPIGKPENSIAFSLGMVGELESCDILSARRIKQIDIGMANSYFFVSHAEITTKNTTLEINEDYSIEIQGEGDIRILNFNTTNFNLPENVNPNPQDGILELVISSLKNNRLIRLGSHSSESQSVFSFNSLNILNNTYKLMLDNSVEIDMPAKISLANFKIPLIVGRERSF